MVKNIRHTGIVVNDLNASLRFYQQLLGFEIVRRMDESGEFISRILAMTDIKVTTVKMAVTDGAMIELLYYYSHPRGQVPRNLCDVGVSHIAFTVNNLDSEYVRLSNEGVLFNSAPQLSPDGYAKVAFCRAPEGTFIELVEVLAQC